MRPIALFLSFTMVFPAGAQIQALSSPKLTQPDAAIRLLPERFMARSRTLERPGAPPIRIPSPEDMVLHLASQEVEDWFSTIRRLVDIDRVVRSEAAFDWSYLRSAAAQARMSQLLGFTLQLTRRLLSTPMPDGFVQSSRHGSSDFDGERVRGEKVSRSFRRKCRPYCRERNY